MTDVSHDVTNRSLLAWVDEIAALCKPDQRPLVRRLARRSTTRLCEQMVESGTFIRLNPEKRPNSFLAAPTRATSPASRTAPSSARVAQGRRRPDQQLDGAARDEGRRSTALFDGCMRGRTMYVDPVQHGPARLADRADRRRAHRLAVRRRQHADHDPHGQARCSTCSATTATSCRCLHSVGVPLEPGQADVPWPCNAEQKYIVHFPEERAIWSLRLAATAATRCSARSASRCASPRCMARDEGWLAEHMLILGVESPEGEKTYVAAAFPSACGKTNFAMLIPPQARWTAGR